VHVAIVDTPSFLGDVRIPAAGEGRHALLKRVQPRCANFQGIACQNGTAVPHFVGSEPHCVANRTDGWHSCGINFGDRSGGGSLLGGGILIMDDEFLKQRARFIRDLADKADPFIKRRLLDLARNYEARLARPSRATATLSNLGSDIEQGR
jgi:hypothetical protein